MPPSSKVVRVFRMLLLLASVGAVLPCIPSFGQEKTPSEFLDTVGDAPDVALPLATDLSPALNRIEVEKAMLKVADWQLERARQGFNQDWTFAVLYSGFMAVSEITGNPKYRDAMLVVGSSLMVYSGFRFAQGAARRGIPIAAVNLGRTRADDLLALKVEDRCEEALSFLL